MNKCKSDSCLEGWSAVFYVFTHLICSKICNIDFLMSFINISFNTVDLAVCNTHTDDFFQYFLYTVEPVLSSHSREAKYLAAKGRWLLTMEYAYLG